MNIHQAVLKKLYNIISENKIEMYDRIAADRTRHVTVIMENIQKNHNASAVLRTCDCFGIQDLHLIEKNVDYGIQRDIAKGAGNWVDIHSYHLGPSPTIECLSDVKNKGYQIIATSPHADKTIEEIPIDKPIALLFGTEQHGVSEAAMEHCDNLIRIPMYGFTESFNVSVSTAILLNQLRNRLNDSEVQWKLSHDEQVKLKIEWCAKIIKNGDAVVEEIHRRILEKE